MSDQDAPGKLIAVEGVDGSGKSTQIHLLHQWLLGSDLQVAFTEWNSSDLVKGATRKGKKRMLLTPTTFSLIHATDFTDRYDRQILPMLQAGYIVLADRYIFTSFARDAVRGCDPAWLRSLYRFARIPDITFYFHVPQNVAAERILSGRPNLKYFEAGMDLGLSPDIVQSFKLYQGMVMEQYQAMAPEFQFITIDATRSIPEQQQILRDIVSEKIELARYRARATA